MKSVKLCFRLRFRNCLTCVHNPENSQRHCLRHGTNLVSVIVVHLRVTLVNPINISCSLMPVVASKLSWLENCWSLKNLFIQPQSCSSCVSKWWCQDFLLPFIYDEIFSKDIRNPILFFDMLNFISLEFVNVFVTDSPIRVLRNK